MADKWLRTSDNWLEANEWHNESASFSVERKPKWVRVLVRTLVIVATVCFCVGVVIANW